MFSEAPRIEWRTDAELNTPHMLVGVKTGKSCVKILQGHHQWALCEAVLRQDFNFLKALITSKCALLKHDEQANAHTHSISMERDAHQGCRADKSNEAT